MAKNWYDKRDIERRFGWTFRQFKTRLTYLDLVISDHCQGGKGQAYKVDDNGLTILDRQHELERDGRNVKEAAKTIVSEFASKQKGRYQGNVNVSESNKQGIIEQLEKRLEEKDQRVKELQSDKKRLQKKNDALEQRLLTGEVEKKNNQLKNTSPWQVIREWFKQPA